MKAIQYEYSIPWLATGLFRLGFSIVRESSVRLREGEVFSFRMCREL